ncbi:MAG: hypothetical protein JW983_02455 [Elusimicrobia bacterium]|nr:hypothetical protein [Elusimicrobiota bacterium]
MKYMYISKVFFVLIILSFIFMPVNAQTQGNEQEVIAKEFVSLLAKEASRLTAPVLVLQGKRDYQVTMADFKR